MRYLASALILALALPLGAQQIRPATKLPADTVRAESTYGVVDGIVTDTNLVPLRGAFVTILRSNIKVGTGPNGRFRITKVPPGQYLLVVTRGGYSPTSMVVEVPTADTLRLSWTLTQLATMLPGVVIAEKSVSLRMLEFEQRKKLGAGEFMSADDIDRRGSVFGTELVRNFKTVNVSPSRTSSFTEYFALSRREGGSFNMQACPMTVYVDQIPMPTPFNLDLLPSPKNIAGIEVYAGPATIPPQFSGMNRGCGIIMVWTKDGF
ncbi:MAG: carboxypeptidase regulatory-like domain-containing protein [Gemmatimonadaceae bacterium]